MDISLDIIVTVIKKLTEVNNIHVQGTVCQNFNLGFGFYFMSKKWATFIDFLKHFFLNCIKLKLGPK